MLRILRGNSRILYFTVTIRVGVLKSNEVQNGICLEIKTSFDKQI